MRNLVILVILTLAYVGANAQTPKYHKAVMYSISNKLDLKMDSYVSLYRHDLDRIDFLDSCAFERANYYSSVIQETSEFRKKTIWESFRMIPDGTNELRAHHELFGDSIYFKRPNVNYIETFRDFPRSGLRIESEIMQQSYWSGKYKNKMDLGIVLKHSLLRLGDKSGDIESHILNEYIESDSHHKCIIKYGNGKYGISTVALISESKIDGCYWKYEVITFNVIVFSKPI